METTQPIGIDEILSQLQKKEFLIVKTEEYENLKKQVEVLALKVKQIELAAMPIIAADKVAD